MKISKSTFQILCFLLFSVSYLIITNIYLWYRNYDTVIFVPGTLIVGLAGYWIGEYVYVHYFNS